MDDAPTADGPLIYAGIDEAGYGPTLGPLTAAMAVFTVNDWTPGDPAPDLWKRLSRVVCRKPAEAGDTKLPVNDSKALKLPNSSKRRHPLTHLERGVLAFLGDELCQTDDALARRLGDRRPDLPWYDGDPVELPLSTTADHVRLLAARLDAASARAGVRTHALQARILPETHFNDRYRAMGTKAAVSFSLIADLLRTLARDVYAAAHGPVRVVIDRQGGRTRYTDALRLAFPKSDIRPLIETEELSRYDIIGRTRPGDAAPPHMRITFCIAAEERHLPVALASMTAKLMRELAMLRFNRHFATRIAEVRPTAGYATDARRWLHDMNGVITAEERRLLVRMA